MIMRRIRQRVERRRTQRRGSKVSWPEPAAGGRVRVLLEYPSFGAPSMVAEVVERAGYEPLLCEGPGDTAGVCRLLETGECALAREADVIFNGYGLGTGEHREIIQALRQHHPGTPLVVETTRPVADQHRDLLRDCQQCEAPLTTERLLDSLSLATGTRRRFPLAT